MAKQSTHLLIRNRTSWDISGTYKHISGHTKGALPGTIPAGHDSALLTASQTTALHGAEGRWDLDLGAGIEAAADRRLVFKHCCSVAKGGNYFRVEQLSPFVSIEARYGNGRPTGDPEWGSESFPHGGSPLGVQLTVSERTPVTAFTVLTYNTHLFEGSNAAIVEPFIKDRLVYKDHERMDEMVDRILALDPDVVCLQEVWAEEWQRRLRSVLNQRYPYVHILPEQVEQAPDLWGSALAANVSGAFDVVDELKNTSGLFVASKFPILQPHFTRYVDATKTEDKWAAKGAFRFNVRLRVTPGGAIDVALATTHAFTRVDPDALANVALMAKETFGHYPRCDAILAGDFNIHAISATEYDRLTAILSQWGARDALQGFDIEEVWTDWPNGTLLTDHLKHRKPDPNPDESTRDRIDYVVHRPANPDQGAHFEPELPGGVSVFHDWKIEDGTEVSDHAPVCLRFTLAGVDS